MFAFVVNGILNLVQIHGKKKYEINNYMTILNGYKHD